jgi:hypothetical protein
MTMIGMTATMIATTIIDRQGLVRFMGAPDSSVTGLER